MMKPGMGAFEEAGPPMDSPQRACVGTVMGAGFASGREIWQSFGVFGDKAWMAFLLWDCFLLWQAP